MGWIKDRINTEYKKHYRITGGLDWSRLAEQKIVLNFISIIDEWEKENTKVIKKDDSILIADYVKWNKIKELKKRISSMSSKEKQ